MTNMETYAAMLRIADSAICAIDTEGARKGALKAIDMAYDYAIKHHVVSHDEALRSANHRREVIAQWYPGQLPDADVWEDEIMDDPADSEDVLVDYSLDQLAEEEYKRYS